MKSTILLHVAPCGAVKSTNMSANRTAPVLGGILLLNVSQLLLEYKVLHSRREYPSQSLLWGPQTPCSCPVFNYQYLRRNVHLERLLIKAALYKFPCIFPVCHIHYMASQHMWYILLCDQLALRWTNTLFLTICCSISDLGHTAVCQSERTYPETCFWLHTLRHNKSLSWHGNVGIISW
jgi:hypothetical protein